MESKYCKKYDFSVNDLKKDTEKFAESNQIDYFCRTNNDNN